MNRLSTWRRRLRIALIVLGAVIAIGGLLLVVIAVPQVVIRASRPDIQTASAVDQLKAENDLRGTLVTVLAGAAVATGTVVAALNFNLQRRGQVTERFSKAIDQLGQRGQGESEKLDIRLGGIYALEQIARDSPELHWPIVEILTAFIREHTKADADAPPPSELPERDQSTPGREVAADIQAALTVLGRRNSESDRNKLDLTRANLQGAALADAQLQGARLAEAQLQRVNFVYVSLEGASLDRANLQGAFLSGANLQGAFLSGANFQGADLSEANLQYADLSGANFQGAILSGANHRYADLSGANLQGAFLSGANLQDAVGLTQEQLDSANCNEKTKPPLGLTVQLRQ